MSKPQITVVREAITAAEFYSAAVRDYEGINCDQCGASMNVGDTRWIVEFRRRIGGRGRPVCISTWFCCSEACVDSAREEIAND